MALTKFQEVKERAETLESLVTAISWKKESTEEEVRGWENRLMVAQADPDENTEWEESNLEKWRYRLSVIRDVEKAIEKML